MDFGAKDQSKARVVPTEDVEASEAAPQKISGAVDDLATSNLLLSSRQSSQDTPTFPVVELNDPPSRGDHGSSFGQQIRCLFLLASGHGLCLCLHVL